MSLGFDAELLGELAPFCGEIIVHELFQPGAPDLGGAFRALLKAYLANP